FGASFVGGEVLQLLALDHRTTLEIGELDTMTRHEASQLTLIERPVGAQCLDRILEEDSPYQLDLATCGTADRTIGFEDHATGAEGRGRATDIDQLLATRDGARRLTGAR